MRIPFTNYEIRSQSHDYTDAVIEVLKAKTDGSERVRGKIPAAAEVCASLWSRAFTSAIVTPDTAETRALTPEVLGHMGRELCLNGEAVFKIDTEGGRVSLIPVTSWDISGRAGWTYKLDMAQPSATVTHTVDGIGVVHIRDGARVSEPWKGRGLLQLGKDAVRLAALLELALSDEASISVGNLMPLPTAGDETEDLQKDLNSLKGQIRVVESTSANWNLGAGANQRPIQDWSPKRLGPNPPVTLETLYESVSRHILAMRSVPLGLVTRSDGTLLRESYRQFLHGAIQPVAKGVIAELSDKLEVSDIAFDFSELMASDITGRARAFGSMVQGGMDVEQAARLSGLLIQDE